MKPQSLRDTALRETALGETALRETALGIAQTEEARRAYREMIVTTPHLGDCINGAILYTETIRQQTKDGIQALAPDAALCWQGASV